MHPTLEKLKGFRQHLLQQIDGLTAQQLNHIPSGYNNNIIWNLAHVVCAEQNMCYVRSGLPIVIDEKYFAPYLSGTRPQGPVEEAEIKDIKAMYTGSLDRLQADLDKGLFVNYTPSIAIRKVYGFDVADIEGALEYLLYHEGFHQGCILSLKHSL